MEAGACKGKENACMTAPHDALQGVQAAAAHSISCAEQPTHEPAESAAHAEASSAGDPVTSQQARSKSTAQGLSTDAPAARGSQATPRTAEVVDLTSDDEHSVQQSKSTGACKPTGACRPQTVGRGHAPAALNSTVAGSSLPAVKAPSHVRAAPATGP